MSISAKSRWALGLLSLAGVYLGLVYVLPAVSASSKGVDGSAACISPQRKLIENGENPSGNPWTITGTIRKNNGCDKWLFGMEFVPGGTAAGSFLFEWGIPAGGHLSDRFTIGAQDETLGTERVIGGAVGERIRRTVVKLSNGELLTIRPKLPSQQLRRQVVWLRNVRYFMRFYSNGQHATVVTLYSANGKVVEKLRAVEGGFRGPGV